MRGGPHRHQRVLSCHHLTLNLTLTLTGTTEFCYVTTRGEQPEMMRAPFRDMARCAIVTHAPPGILVRLCSLSGVRAVEFKRLKKRPKEAGPDPKEAAADVAWQLATHQPVPSLPTRVHQEAN